MATKHIKLSKYKRVACNVYNQKVYVHFNEVGGKKSVTLSLEEFQTLGKKFSKLQKIVQLLQKRSKKTLKESNTSSDEETRSAGYNSDSE